MIQIIIGYILDLIIGDPYGLFHPVRWIGKYIKKLENILLKESDKPRVQKNKGLLLLFIVMTTAFLIPYVILYIALQIHILLFIVIESFMIFQIFATKCLDVETKKVFRALKNNDLEEARHYISFLVSRDTSEMTTEDIIKAAIETIAENLADGVVAPICFVMLGGAPLGWLYKSVNTLDSMVGYKSEKYLHYGFASARFDDVLNFIPARLTAIFILVAGFFLRLDIKNGFKMMMRDRYNHSSPNSAYPESAAAGLLKIQLGGKASYFGVVSKKPTMGDSIKNIEVKDLKNMSKLLYTTSFIGFIIMLCIKGFVGL